MGETDLPVLEDRPADGRVTLFEARRQVRGALRLGTRCPCCEQHARAYRRALNATMAAGLLWLVGADERRIDRGPGAWDYVNVQARGPRWLVRAGGTLATLAVWGFVERAPKVAGQAGRTSGIWRPTLEGTRFAKGERPAPRYVVLYANRVVRFEGPEIGIRAALGQRFTYEDLLAGR